LFDRRLLRRERQAEIASDALSKKRIPERAFAKMGADQAHVGELRGYH
jgi:hypothetical protein